MLIKDKMKDITNNPQHLKNLAFRQRKTIMASLSAMILFVLAITAVYHNYSWYDTTIVKITQVKNSQISESAENSQGEKYYEQKIFGSIMNGPYRGSQIELQNRFSSSQVYDDNYKIGDDVFISINKSSGQLTGSILGLKRDKYLAILCSVFVLLIVMIAKKRGLLSIFSLLINIAVFWYALRLYSSGTNILLLSNGMVILFTAISLVFISGWNKKTLTAISSTLISLFFTIILFKAVMMFTDGVDYAFMEYISNPNDLPEIFLSQMILGGLGAIMDVAITEAATIHELIENNSEISAKELIQSGREVGHDIMGTMINVMLFTYISGSIPLIILKMNSEIKLHTIILWHMPMELHRFFIGSIGILLTIPISLFVSILIFQKRRSAA